MPTGVYIRTPEYREKQRLAMLRRVNPGKNKSEETKKKIGDYWRGREKSKEWREKQSKRMKGCVSPMKGKNHSEENKKRMRENTGNKSGGWRGGKFNSCANRSEYSVMLRRKKNGFTEELFFSRVKDQNNKCAICKNEFDENIVMLKKSADHCHETNEARGILCRKCNVLLGNANDNIEILKSAIEYLNIWQRTA